LTAINQHAAAVGVAIYRGSADDYRFGAGQHGGGVINTSGSYQFAAAVKCGIAYHHAAGDDPVNIIQRGVFDDAATGNQQIAAVIDDGADVRAAADDCFSTAVVDRCAIGNTAAGNGFVAVD